MITEWFRPTAAAKLSPATIHGGMNIVCPSSRIADTWRIAIHIISFLNNA
jgi:hypothetical protein